MGVEIVRPWKAGDSIEGLIKKVQKNLGIALNKEVNEIKKSTDQGKDYQGDDFEPYSKGYAKYKFETLERGGTASGKPDLRLTGAMMNSLGVLKISLDRGKVIGTIGFKESGFSLSRLSGRKVSIAEKVRWNNERRKFFALSDKAVKRLETAILK